MKRVVYSSFTNLAVMLSCWLVTSLLASTASSPPMASILACCSSLPGDRFRRCLHFALDVQADGQVEHRRQVIETPRNSTELWLMETVGRLAQKAGCRCRRSPSMKASRTPCDRSQQEQFLVAVSTGLLAGHEPREVEAVLAHEVAHIANGDMVTPTLIQGVVNTFVVFIFARHRVRRRFLSAQRRGKQRTGHRLHGDQHGVRTGLRYPGHDRRTSRASANSADAGAAGLLGTRAP